MRDMAHAIIDQDLDPKFEQTCMEIVESREKRGYNSTKHAPKFYPVLPKIRPDSTAATDIAQKNDVQLGEYIYNKRTALDLKSKLMILYSKSEK